MTRSRQDRKRAHTLQIFVEESASHSHVIVDCGDSTLLWEVAWALAFKTLLMPNYGRFRSGVHGDQTSGAQYLLQKDHGVLSCAYVHRPAGAHSFIQKRLLWAMGPHADARGLCRRWRAAVRRRWCPKTAIWRTVRTGQGQPGLCGVSRLFLASSNPFHVVHEPTDTALQACNIGDRPNQRGGEQHTLHVAASACQTVTGTGPNHDLCAPPDQPRWLTCIPGPLLPPTRHVGGPEWSVCGIMDHPVYIV